MQTSAEERELVMGEDLESGFCSITTYETLSKSLCMASCFFVGKEKISEIMNRKPFVNWQVLGKPKNTSDSINKSSVVN